MTVERIATLVGAGIAIAVAAVAVVTLALHAEEAYEQSRSNEKQIELLTDIHLKQEAATEAAEKARKETIEKLCDQGKLKGRDCREVEE